MMGVKEIRGRLSYWRPPEVVTFVATLFAQKKKKWQRKQCRRKEDKANKPDVHGMLFFVCFRPMYGILDISPHTLSVRYDVGAPAGSSPRMKSHT